MGFQISSRTFLTPNAVPHQWLDVSGVVQPVLQMFSDNHVYLDNSVVGGNILIRPNGGIVAATFSAAGVSFPKTITGAGTTGAQTISKTMGSVNFAAAAQTLVVTNTLVTTASVIIATVATDDATALNCKAIPAAGSFTLKLNAAATAETRVNWVMFN